MVASFLQQVGKYFSALFCIVDVTNKVTCKLLYSGIT